MSDLIERLRQLADNTGKMTWVGDMPMPASAVLHLSADRIAELEAENARLERSAAGWQADAKRYADNADYWKNAMMTDTPTHFRFRLGDKVRKVRGSSWRGTVCGWYSTDHTPEGYNVNSDFEPGSVQCWPLAALEAWEIHNG